MLHVYLFLTINSAGKLLLLLTLHSKKVHLKLGRLLLLDKRRTILQLIKTDKVTVARIFGFEIIAVSTDDSKIILSHEAGEFSQ